MHVQGILRQQWFGVSVAGRGLLGKGIDKSQGTKKTQLGTTARQFVASFATFAWNDDLPLNGDLKCVLDWTSAIAA